MVVVVVGVESWILHQSWNCASSGSMFCLKVSLVALRLDSVHSSQTRTLDLNSPPSSQSLGTLPSLLATSIGALQSS